MLNNPTRQEIDAAIASWHNVNELDEFDIEQAIYWFAADYHTGLWSNLYSVASTSKYRPSPLEFGVSHEEIPGWLYDFLVTTFEMETNNA